MNVNLGPVFDEFVAALLKTGLYQSQSEVIREALRLLKEREEFRELKRRELRKEINVGLKQVEKGQYRDFDARSLKEFFQSIKARGRRSAIGSKRKRSA